MKKEINKKSLQGLGIIFIATGTGITTILNMYGGFGLIALGVIFLIIGISKK